MTRGLGIAQDGKMSKDQLKKQRLPFLSEVIAESLWRAPGWVFARSGRTRCWKPCSTFSLGGDVLVEVYESF